MSKLIERLEKVGAVAPTPMGFGANRVAEKAPSLLLAALSGIESATVDSKLKVDSYIIAAEKAAKSELEAARSAVGDALWGLWPNSLTSASLNDLKQEGADFFVFSALDAPAEALADEELGRFIAIPVEFPEELGHSLEEMPVDGVLLVGLEEACPLSVKDLMQVRSVIDLISKPLLLLRSHPLKPGELAVLRDVGVQGMVVDLRSMKVEDAVQMEKDIHAMPPRKTRHDHAGALLPRLSTRTAAPQREDEDWEEEEEED